jgi:hypothetical protein
MYLLPGQLIKTIQIMSHQTNRWNNSQGVGQYYSEILGSLNTLPVFNGCH